MANARTALLAASLGAALGLVLGAAVGVRIASDAPLPAEVPDTGSAHAATRDARLAELEAEVTRWRNAYEALARAQGEGQGAASEARGDAPPEAPAAPPEQAGAPVGVGRPFDAESLQARGYTEEETRRLRERYEAYELELLYLSDRAKREGWRHGVRFLGESRHLSEKLQSELGDRDYDAVLYASGRNNRVQVAGVLANSAAARAGLRDGDEIVSYDNRRVYEAQALVRATTQGDAGAQTEMRVRRDGQEVVLLVPRGPIGVRLQPARVPPEGFM